MAGCSFPTRFPAATGRRPVPFSTPPSLPTSVAGPGLHGSFTGAFVGMAAQDLNGTATSADFSYFVYRPLKR